MTRINVIPVEELCDQHLFAEFRELTRIPNGILSGKLKVHYDDRPSHYVLGPGHIKFFTDKLFWLYTRYKQLFAELRFRGYNAQFIWPAPRGNVEAWKNYTPSVDAIQLNASRIMARMPAKPRWTNRTRPDWTI